MRSIEYIFNTFVKEKVPINIRKDLKLASGGIYDTKAPKQYSDIDIVYFCVEYDKLDNIFPFTKELRNDGRCFYKTKYLGREVNIMATNDKRHLRSLKHRETELALNKYEHIKAAAILNKISGDKTEYAYTRALGINPQEIDPYELIADKNKCLKLAKNIYKRLNKIMKDSP